MRPPDLRLEEAAGRLQGRKIAGVDEAGRGPLAGPVVAAAVILPLHGIPDETMGRLRDSKMLTPRQRRILADVLRMHSDYGLGAASVAEIDDLNILQASLLAMRRAVAQLADKLGAWPDHVLIDGNQLPQALPCPARVVVDGDIKVMSIAAASILAKVAHDRIFHGLSARYPGYGWETNMGYGTQAHRQALGALGPTPHHRLSFEPLATALRAA
ncbi:MAG: ribonuclease HII [Alphaproteobacteria bacterium]|nr:MAG: ribonuclease HII [Alphaproteobacteria bacterium]